MYYKKIVPFLLISFLIKLGISYIRIEHNISIKALPSFEVASSKSLYK